MALNRENNTTQEQNLTLLSCPCLIIESTRLPDTVYIFLLHFNPHLRKLRSFRMIRTQPQPGYLSSIQHRLLSNWNHFYRLENNSHYQKFHFSSRSWTPEDCKPQYFLIVLWITLGYIASTGVTKVSEELLSSLFSLEKSFNAATI